MPRLTKQQRRGFTMVELLIVVAIIGLLMSIIGVAAMNSISGARVSATKSLMTKLQLQIQSRLEAVQRSDVYRSQKDFQGSVFLEGAAVDVAARRGGATRASLIPRVKTVLAHKVLERQYLPQTWFEAAYLLARAGRTAPPTGSINPLNESAEVLYFFLNDSSVVGYTPANQDLFGGNEVRDTDGNGFPEIVDGWGRPVRFYRWPTRLVRSAGFSAAAVTPADFERARTLIPAIPSTLTQAPLLTNPGSMTHDPDDVLNVIKPGNGWLANAAEAAAVEAGTGTFSGSPFPLHTLFTWHVPLVVSAGVDGDFGIFDPTDALHFGRLCETIQTGTGPQALYDNITTQNVKSGGK